MITSRATIGRALAALLVSASTLVGVATASSPAGAQSTAPTFTLAGQSPWVAPGADFVLRFDATNVPADAEVALTVHDEVISRSEFDASVEGTNLQPTRARQTFPFGALAIDQTTGERVLTYPTTNLGTGGVFPLEVDLRSGNGNQSLAHFVTHAVVAPLQADGTYPFQPLNVAWVWPLQAEPGYVAVDTANDDTLAALNPAGRLGRQAAQLAANTDVPLTLAPSPETLDAWSALSRDRADLASGPTAIRTATGRNQVIAAPFVPLDLPSLRDAGYDDEIVSQEINRGVSSLESFYGAQLVDTTTALPGTFDAAAVRTLLNAGRRQLIVEGNALTAADERFTPAHPYKMRAVEGDDSSAVTVVATDTGFEKFLSGDQPAALRAAHLLAGLAVVARERPSLSRGIAFANPEGWDANGVFVNAVLAGLRSNPLLRPVTVKDFVAAVPTATVDDNPDGAPVYRQLAASTSPRPPLKLGQYNAGLVDLGAVRSNAPAGDAPVTAERALASSLSSEWANRPGRADAAALVRSIRTSLDAYLSQVEVQAQGTITVTSSKAEIPIGFRNNSDDDITVRLKLESDRLLFPKGNEQVVRLPHNRNTTVRVAVETRGSGRAPVHMTVTTADGLPIPKSNVTITVRSSFVSGVGVFLTVGAIVFLVLWWGWDIHRRRKKRSRDQHPTYRLAPPSGQPA